MSSFKRSPWAVVASMRDICSARSNRRSMLLASAKTNSGPAKPPSASSDSAHLPSVPGVDQCRYEHRCVDDSRHVRSASRARRILDGGTRVCATALRSRTPCSHAAMEGRDAMRSNSPRKNSCMDWR